VAPPRGISKGSSENRWTPLSKIGLHLASAERAFARGRAEAIQLCTCVTPAPPPPIAEKPDFISSRCLIRWSLETVKRRENGASLATEALTQRRDALSTD
jgi:hypothetical protein